MQIGIISDTHNSLTAILDSLDFFLSMNIKIVFHAGDWTKPETVKFFAVEAHKRGMKVYGVFGNNDQKFKDEITRMNSKFYNKITFPKDSDYYVYKYKNIRLGIYHGDDKKRLEEILKLENLKAIFCGHSHIPKKEFILNTQVLNPGTVAYNIPFRKKDEVLRTAGIYDTQKRSFEIYEI